MVQINHHLDICDLKITASLRYHLPWDIQVLDGESLGDITLSENGADFAIHPPTFEGEKHYGGSRQDASTGGVRESYWLADVITMDVTKEEDPVDAPEEALEFEALGKVMLQRFLRNCRVVTGQSHILQPLLGRMRYTSKGVRQDGFELWHSEGIEIKMAYPASQILRLEKWNRIGADMQSANEPALWDELVSDARSMITIPRRCIIETAIAVELRIKEFVRVKGVAKDPIYDFFLVTRTTINQFLDTVLPKLGLDLKSRDPDTYREVLHLFRARNSIAHKGICEYQSLTDGKMVRVGQKEAHLLVESAEKLISVVNSC